MKYEKAREIVKQHLWLKKEANDFRCSRKAFDVSPKNRQFIEKKIEYVAFRPFEHLDLNFEGRCIEELKVFGDRYRIYNQVIFEIFYHLEGERFASRVKVPDKVFLKRTNGDRETTVEKWIGSVIKMAQYIKEYFSKEGKRIIFDAVIKYIVFAYHYERSAFGSEGYQWTGESTYTMSVSLDIYLFPPNWMPEGILAE